MGASVCACACKLCLIHAIHLVLCGQAAAKLETAYHSPPKTHPGCGQQFYPVSVYEYLIAHTPECEEAGTRLWGQISAPCCPPVELEIRRRSRRTHLNSFTSSSFHRLLAEPTSRQ